MRYSTRFVIGLAALVPVAAAAPAQAAKLAGCGSTSASILFWPKGHNARPGVGFPKFKTPHVEVYGGKHTTSFPNSAQDAYLDATGQAASARKCSVGVAKFSGKAVSGATRTTAANVICSFGEKVSYRLGKISGGARLQIVLSDGTVVLDLKIKKSGSKVSFSSTKCKAHAPPS